MWRAGWQGKRPMIGFKILQRPRAVSADVVERFRRLPVANVSDNMARMFAGGARLRPIYAGGTMSGPALTVKTRPGDNLLVHKAIMMAEPGDIIVVDAGGDLTNAIIGEIMVTEAEVAKVGGFVIDGAIRDSGTLKSGSFPVFAAGVTHRGPYKDGPGEINVPIAIDGMVINPGDLILGDDDGIVCVAYEDVEEIYAATVKKHAIEEQSLIDIRAGKRSKQWVDDALKRLGCEIHS